ncbi:hypothetical protein I7I48_01818 [Histoplasma ohiense]|nr:hypothetical protein I7I48_01818 [Histoplasma ohiense (nom. inval.)]
MRSPQFGANTRPLCMSLTRAQGWIVFLASSGGANITFVGVLRMKFLSQYGGMVCLCHIWSQYESPLISLTTNPRNLYSVHTLELLIITPSTDSSTACPSTASS